MPNKSFATLAYEELSREFDRERVRNVHIFDVLDRFRREPPSASSIQRVLDLCAEVCGPLDVSIEEKAVRLGLDALCGPMPRHGAGLREAFHACEGAGV